MLNQSRNAKEVIIFRHFHGEGIGGALNALLETLQVCRYKRYYCIIDDSGFGPIRFTDAFIPLWDNQVNQEILNSAEIVHVFFKFPRHIADLNITHFPGKSKKSKHIIYYNRISKKRFLTENFKTLPLSLHRPKTAKEILPSAGQK